MIEFLLLRKMKISGVWSWKVVDLCLLLWDLLLIFTNLWDFLCKLICCSSFSIWKRLFFFWCLLAQKCFLCFHKCQSSGLMLLFGYCTWVVSSGKLFNKVTSQLQENTLISVASYSLFFVCFPNTFRVNKPVLKVCIPVSVCLQEIHLSIFRSVTVIEQR